MNIFLQSLKTEQKRMQRLMDLTAPAAGEEARSTGSLTVERRGQQRYCYVNRYQKGTRTQKKYLGKPDSTAVQEYAAAKYKKELYSRLARNQELLQTLAKNYQNCDRSSIIAALPGPYREVISGSYFNHRYEEIRQWANAPYEKNTAPYHDSENYAADGTRTRSKGETIFYNLFLETGVLFRYDCLIQHIDERGRIHTLSPDFLIQCLDGTLIAIEHLGWYGGLSYGLGFGEKSYYYLQEGFILGKNYFTTSDDKHGGTDSAAIQQVANQVQRLFYGF